MPLISIETINACTDTRLALWHITETEDDFLNGNLISKTFLNTVKTKFKSASRRRETLAVRAALNALFGHGTALSHDAEGRPFLDNGYKVSISHTKGYAAVIVSRFSEVSVDIEYISPRALRIKNMYLRDDEKALTQTSAILHWCAKETVFKLFPTEHLTFSDMRVNGISGDGITGIINTEDISRGVLTDVQYRITGEYVLTYAAKPGT